MGLGRRHNVRHTRRPRGLRNVVLPRHAPEAAAEKSLGEDSSILDKVEQKGLGGSSRLVSRREVVGDGMTKRRLKWSKSKVPKRQISDSTTGAGEAGRTLFCVATGSEEWTGPLVGLDSTVVVVQCR